MRSIDFATQLLLVIIGFALIFSPHTLVANIHWGVAPTWSNFLLAIPIGMVAYTGIETVSNLAEEARDPARNVPRAYLLTVIAVFAIYFTLPAIARDGAPGRHVEHACKGISGHYQTQLACPPPEGFQNDPVLGLVENLGIQNATLLHTLKIYVGILAATILFIGTNAGVIGASRITYSMAHYRQLPEVFRRIHPKLPHAVDLPDLLRRPRPDHHAPPREGGLPLHDVLVRRDALVHDRAPGGDHAPRARPGRGARLQGPAEPADQRSRLAALCPLRRGRHRWPRGW